MKRYDFKVVREGAGAPRVDMSISESDGDWVRYEDAEKCVQYAEVLKAALKPFAELAELELLRWREGLPKMDVYASTQQITVQMLVRARDALAKAPGCQCPACIGGIRHASDCAVHNAPALPVGDCDCGVGERGGCGDGCPGCPICQRPSDAPAEQS